MADYSNMDASYIDSDFDSFLAANKEKDPDEPDYYQAKDDDFETQSIKVKPDRDEASEDSLDTSAVEQMFRGGTTGKKPSGAANEIDAKCAFQLMCPNWVYGMLPEELQDMPPNYMMALVGSFLTITIFGISLLFMEDEQNQRLGFSYVILLYSVLIGLVASYILRQEVYRDVEEDEKEFVAKMEGIGLWEVKKQKDSSLHVDLRRQDNLSSYAISQEADTGIDSQDDIDIDVIPAGSLEYLLHRFKMEDPTKEREMLVKTGLGFIWLSFLSAIACGYLTAMDQDYPSQEIRDAHEIQTSLIGITGWIVVFAAIYIFVKRNKSRS